MEEKDKISAIEDYLKELFPGSAIENMWDPESGRHVFRVNSPTGKTKHTIAITSEFFSANKLEDVVPFLKLSNLKGYLEIFGSKEVLVTDEDINPEGIRPSVFK